MRYAKISYFDTSNGPGARTVLWVQGCTHECKGCHNPDTWNPICGKTFTEDNFKRILMSIKPDYIRGITYSGGDPLHPNNIEGVTNIAKYIREVMPKKTQWLYTGFSWNEIKKLDIMKYIDVVVDGEYIEDKRDITLRFRGSKNQRIIDVQKSLKKHRVILYDK